MKAIEEEIKNTIHAYGCVTIEMLPYLIRTGLVNWDNPNDVISVNHYIETLHRARHIKMDEHYLKKNGVVKPDVYKLHAVWMLIEFMQSMKNMSQIEKDEVLSGLRLIKNGDHDYPILYTFVNTKEGITYRIIALRDGEDAYMQYLCTLLVAYNAQPSDRCIILVWDDKTEEKLKEGFNFPCQSLLVRIQKVSDDFGYVMPKHQMICQQEPVEFAKLHNRFMEYLEAYQE